MTAPAAAPVDSAPRLPREVAWLALAWSLFQLWQVANLSQWLGLPVLLEAQQRSLHLGFAVALGYLLFSPRALRPLRHVLALVAALSAAYLALNYAALAERPGDSTDFDTGVALLGLVLLFVLARRTLGVGLVAVCCVLLLYAFAGQWLPDVVAHKAASASKVAEHLWLSTEGVFGVALGVSAGFIFLFVLFGALLDISGGGAYMVRAALALFGHTRGGPAKAAVMVSAVNGMIAGSPVTNVVTTGPVTIPLIRRIGYPPEKAAAVEVVASVNAQMMPPVMGAAAFLIADFVGTSYASVLRHTVIAAIVSYVGLLYIVHLEAVKAGMRGMPRRPRAWLETMGHVGTGVAWVVVSAMLVTVLLWGLRTVVQVGWAVHGLVALGLLVTYLLMLAAARNDAAPGEGAEVALRVLPPAWPAWRSGLYFWLPIGLMVWNLAIERRSPAAAMFPALLLMAVIVVTQKVGRAWLAGEREGAVLAAAWRSGWGDLYQGLINGALNMITVALGTALAGIVMGVVTLTGVGFALTELIHLVSGGHMLGVLMLVAGACLVLGTGLTTTTNYIVLSTLLVPVIVTLGAQHHVYVSLIAAHLFVFYFGMMADMMPPVGLATHAAASIAGANPVNTGIIAMRYSRRMVLLPFLMIFNPALLLIGVEGWLALAQIGAATLSAFVFIAFNQRYLAAPCTAPERIVLLVATLMLLHPALFMDRLVAPRHTETGAEALAAIVSAHDDSLLRLRVSGTTLEGEEMPRGVLLRLGPQAGSLAERLAQVQLTVADGDAYLIEDVGVGSMAARLGVVAGDRIVGVDVPVKRPPEQWFWLLALVLVAGVWGRQRRRRRLERAARLASAEANPAQQQ